MTYYGKEEYWQERYSQSTEPYEWYQSYHGIRHLFTPFNLSALQGLNPAKPRRILETQEYIPRLDSSSGQKNCFPNRSDCRVLIVGCGNSQLGEDMIRDGWTGGITCVDWSSIVIQQMRDKYTPNSLQKIAMTPPRGHRINPISDDETKLMSFICADVLQGLPFEDASFDLIVCKGTFDAILSGIGAVANAALLNEECYRLLNNDHGAMLVVTHGNPENRIVHFENPGDEWWSGVGIHNIPKPPKTKHQHVNDRDQPKFHFAYICRKSQNRTRIPKTSTNRAISSSVSNEENDSAILDGNCP